MDRPLIIAVGSLERHKGHDVLLDATHAWQRLDPAPLVVIAGEGPLHGELQNAIETRELPVRLIGRREDAPELLTAADLALLPSRSEEARSTFAQEALHARVPLVATPVGGSPNSSATPRNSCPGDSEALAEAGTRPAPGSMRPLDRSPRPAVEHHQAGSWPLAAALMARAVWPAGPD
ncbi:Glycosyltransferase involved in cell wall biosynthesis OS=Streptomyces albaduncus OX=68172 GN=FHS32_006431 PE=4 SV=1 [Streptomyces griseoloalbus]